MTTVDINGQCYDVHEEVAEQFSKFIRRANSKDKEIAAGLEREEGMLVAIDNLQQQLKSALSK